MRETIRVHLKMQLVTLSKYDKKLFFIKLSLHPDSSAWDNNLWKKIMFHCLLLVLLMAFARFHHARRNTTNQIRGVSNAAMIKYELTFCYCNAYFSPQMFSKTYFSVLFSCKMRKFEAFWYVENSRAKTKPRPPANLLILQLNGTLKYISEKIWRIGITVTEY